MCVVFLKSVSHSIQCYASLLAFRAGPPGILGFLGHWLLKKNLLYSLGDSLGEGQSSSLAPSSFPQITPAWSLGLGNFGPLFEKLRLEKRDLDTEAAPPPQGCLVSLVSLESRPELLPSLLSPLLCSSSSCRESQLQLQATAWLLRCPQATSLTPSLPSFLGPPRPCPFTVKPGVAGTLTLTPGT